MKNNNFHILTVMAGTCNTPDVAYRTLYFELEELQHAYDLAEAGTIKSRLEYEKLKRNLKWSFWSKSKQESIKADIIKLSADVSRHLGAKQRSQKEIAFIKQLMEEIEPMRKYQELPLLEAFQACQAEEMALEWVKRIKRFLITQNGYIPQDHFELMVVHPWFESYILPRMEELKKTWSEGQLTLANYVDEKPEYLKVLLKVHPELVVPAATLLLKEASAPQIAPSADKE